MVELAKERGLPVIAANAPRRYVSSVARKGLDYVKEVLALGGAGAAWVPPVAMLEASEAYENKFNGFFSAPLPSTPVKPAAAAAAAALSEAPSPISTADVTAAMVASEKRKEEQKRTVATEATEKKEKEEMGSVNGNGKATPKPLKQTSGNGNSDGEREGDRGPVCPHLGVSKKDNMLAAQLMWDASMALSINTALASYPGAMVVAVNGKFHSEERLGTVEKLVALRPEVRRDAFSV